MTLDEKPVEESKVENESSDFEEFCDIEEPKKDFFSNSTSSSDGERTEIEDSDNDSGFAGILHRSLNRLDTATPEVYECERGSKNDSSKTRGNETYDREAIIHRLVNDDNLNRLKYVMKIGRFRKEAAAAVEQSSKSFEPRKSKQEEDTDNGYQRSKFERAREALQAVPDSLLHLLAGADRPGDCGRPSDRKPDWLNEEKLRLGQKFAQDHFFPVYFAEMLSLFALFSFEDGLRPLIITGKSSTSYTAFKRYLSTGLRVRNWYTQDPWAEGTTAWKDIRTVKAMHAVVRRRLEESTNEEIDAAAEIPNPWCPAREILLKDFSEACEAPAIGQCPYMMERNNPERSTGMNQTDMACTQWGFVGLIICYPKHFGVHYATDEDLEAYCHLWRSIGYQLGIEDEFNFCRGTLEDVRHRSRDFIEAWVKPNLRQITPEWEHIMRCLTSGMSVIVNGMSYETALLHLTKILGLDMPRLYASLSYKDWINYNLSKSLFNYSIKLPGMLRLFNFILNHALDRVARLTPKELEAVRIQLSKYPGS